MTELTCPACNSASTYQDRNQHVCAECFHEWNPAEQTPTTETPTHAPKFLDANGVQLQDGDIVITIKDLKVGKDTLKSGTKVKGIRLLDDPVDGHDVSCKIPDFGALYLKCSVVKKAK